MQNFKVLKSLGKFINKKCWLGLFLIVLFSLRIGEGAFSTVYKVQRISDGQEYALKKVRII